MRLCNNREQHLRLGHHNSHRRPPSQKKRELLTRARRGSPAPGGKVATIRHCDANGKPVEQQ